MDDHNTDSGRVKGSIKDRLISFLFRKRFKIKLQKNYYSNRKINILTSKKNNILILNYRDLNKLGDKVIPVDLKTEKFDFDKYDYYIIEPVIKKGLDDKNIEKYRQQKRNIKNIKNSIRILKQDLLSMKDVDYKKIEEKKNELIKRRNNLEKEIKKNKDISINTYFIDNISINNLDEINKKISLYEQEIDKFKNQFTIQKNAIIDRSQKLKSEFLMLDIDNLNVDYLDNINIISTEDIIEVTQKLDFYQNELEKYENNLNVIDGINTAEFINPIGIESEEEVVDIVEDKNDIKENVKIDREKKEIDNDSDISLFAASEKKIEEKKQEVNNNYNRKVIKKMEKDNINLDDNTKKDLEQENKKIVKISKQLDNVKENKDLDKKIDATLEIAQSTLEISVDTDKNSNTTKELYLINKKISEIDDLINNILKENDNNGYIFLNNNFNLEKNNIELIDYFIKDSINKINRIKKNLLLDVDNYNKINKLENILLDKYKEIELLQYNEKLIEKNKVKVKENKNNI